MITDGTIDTVRRMVIEKFDAMQHDVSDFQSQTTGYINGLMEAVAAYNPEFSNLARREYSFDTTAEAVDDPDRPDITADYPLPPNRPDLDEDITLEELSTLPSFAEAFPAVSFPDDPTDLLTPEDPGAPPADLGTVELPNAGDYTGEIPETPVLSEIPEVPSAPVLDMPTFDATPPSGDLGEPPEASFVYSERNYQSELLDATRAALLPIVRDGGTGLDTDWEEAVYDRGREKVRESNERMYDEATRGQAERGFPMPPGAFPAAAARVMREVTKNENALAWEITKKQLELGRDFFIFAVNGATALEQVTVDLFLRSAQLAFEVAKYRHQAAMIEYEAKVKKLETELRVYETRARVFTELIRAESLKLEAWKARLEGIRLVSENNRQLVELYNARVNGLVAITNLYNAKVKAAMAKVDVKKAEIDLYRSRVEAFASQIRGNTERWNQYLAELEAKVKSPVEVYGQKVAAYKTRVDAARVEADLKIAKLNGLVDVERQKVETYRADVEAYGRRVDAVVRQLGLSVDLYRADTQLYSEKNRRALSDIGNRLQGFQSKMQYSIEQARMLIAEYQANEATRQYEHGQRVAASQAIARVAAQLYASAFSAVSAAASMSVGTSVSASEDTTKSTPTESHSHHYSH